MLVIDAGEKLHRLLQELDRTVELARVPRGRRLRFDRFRAQPNGALLRVFLYAGLYIGIIGMLVGVLGGIGICVFLGNVGLPLDPEIYYISELPVRMDPLEIAIVALAGVTLSFLATIYPSLLAARLRPADGLRRHDA